MLASPSKFSTSKTNFEIISFDFIIFCTHSGNNETFARYRNQWGKKSHIVCAIRLSSGCAREESTNESHKANQAQESSTKTIQIEIKSNSVQISYFYLAMKFN